MALLKAIGGGVKTFLGLTDTPSSFTANHRLKVNSGGTAVESYASSVIDVVQDYGATGDGTTDDTTAIQNALNAGAGKLVYFPPGTYLIDTAALQVDAGTTIFGVYGSSIIKIGPSMASNAYLLRNKNFTLVSGQRDDINIIIRGLVFDGNKSVRGNAHTNILVGILKTEDTRIEDCIVQNHSYIGIALLGDLNTVISNCTFHDNGKTTGVSPCVYATTFTADSPYTHTSNPTVIGCDFYDNDRSGMLFAPKDGGKVMGCTFTNCSESTLFVGGIVAGTSDPGAWIQIIGNRFTNSIITDVAASSIEADLTDYLEIGGNFFDSPDGSGVSLKNCQHTRIHDNIFRNTCQVDGYPTGAPHSAIQLVTSNNIAGTMNDVDIYDNTFIDDQGSPTQLYCIGTHDSGTTPPEISDISIYNNDFTDGYGTDVFLWQGSGPETATLRIYNNRGYDTVMTTKGDILTFDTAQTRLAVGTDGDVLTADSAQAEGVKWSAPANFGVDGGAFTDTYVSTSNVDGGTFV